MGIIQPPGIGSFDGRTFSDNERIVVASMLGLEQNDAAFESGDEE